MNPHAWGFFALVSYVPDPLGPCLDGMRQAMPGAEFRQAHITILPPRPLKNSVETVSQHVRTLLRNFQCFTVELSSVRRFEETNVLYLDLAEGSEQVHAIHDALNQGDLEFKEEFQFHPHLTIAGPLTPESVEPMQWRAEKLWNAIRPQGSFVLRDIVALWADPRYSVAAWQRLWTYSLGLEARMAQAGFSGQTF
jgi:hypothetical protein